MTPVEELIAERRRVDGMGRRTFLAGCITAFAGANRAASNEPPPYLQENAVPFVKLDTPWLQSFALDGVTEEIYAQFVRPERKWLTEVHRLKRKADGTTQLVDKQLPTDLLGHQSLAIERTSGRAAFWMAAPGTGWSAVRFEYVADGAPANVQDYVLFDRSFLPASLNVTVSHDQSWLIATSRRKEYGRSQNKLRIFDLSKLLEGGPGDHANDHVAEWDVHSEPRMPIQGLACSKATIFIVYGRSSAKLPKPLAAYNLAGILQSFRPDVRTGRAVFLGLGEGTNYEPEGLTVANLSGDSAPSLLLGINGGGRSKRINHIYNLGSA